MQYQYNECLNAHSGRAIPLLLMAKNVDIFKQKCEFESKTIKDIQDNQILPFNFLQQQCVGMTSML